MAGRRHINDDNGSTLLSGSFQQVEDAEDSQNFIHPGRHNVEQRGKEPTVEAQIDVDSAVLAAQRALDHALHALAPALEFSDGVEFSRAQSTIAMHGCYLIPDFLPKDVIQRWRRVSGADSHKFLRLGVSLDKCQSRGNGGFANTSFAQSERKRHIEKRPGGAAQALFDAVVSRRPP